MQEKEWKDIRSRRARDYVFARIYNFGFFFFT